MNAADTLQSIVAEWNSSRTDGITASARGRSCIFGRGFACDCCKREYVLVTFSTDSTSRGVGARLVAAARSLRAHIPESVKVTREKKARYYYGECTYALATTFTVRVWH